MEKDSPSFDPEGADYDMASAVKAGLKPDKTGHWPSRDPKSGLILKGAKHKTFRLTEEAEAKAGYKIQKGDDGRYYSHKMTDDELFEAGFASTKKESRQ